MRVCARSECLNPFIEKVGHHKFCCVACEREEAKQRQRERYLLSNKALLNERAKKWRKKNKNRVSQLTRAWRLAHPEKINFHGHPKEDIKRRADEMRYAHAFWRKATK